MKLLHNGPHPYDAAATAVPTGFSRTIRERRRELNLTQREVARRIGSSVPYVGHLECGKRRPSDKALGQLADVLGLDRHELFLLANPDARELLRDTNTAWDISADAWEEFRNNETLRRLHRISEREMEMLSRVALMGRVRSAHDFIYILNTVRHALVT